MIIYDELFKLINEYKSNGIKIEIITLDINLYKEFISDKRVHDTLKILRYDAKDYVYFLNTEVRSEIK